MAKFIVVRDLQPNNDVLVNFDWVKKITIAEDLSAVIHFGDTEKDSNHGDCIFTYDNFHDLMYDLTE